MLSIFANAMRIATKTTPVRDPEMQRFQQRRESCRANNEFYKRWAETEGRYLR